MLSPSDCPRGSQPVAAGSLPNLSGYHTCSRSGKIMKGSAVQLPPAVAGQRSISLFLGLLRHLSHDSTVVLGPSIVTADGGCCMNFSLLTPQAGIEVKVMGLLSSNWPLCGKMHSQELRGGHADCLKSPLQNSFQCLVFLGCFSKT